MLYTTVCNYNAVVLKGNDSDEVLEHSPDKQEIAFFSFKPKTSLIGGKKKVHTINIDLHNTLGPHSFSALVFSLLL